MYLIKRIIYVFLIFQVSVFSCSDHKPDTGKDERMRWWRQAKFGMFIHWGLYAIPAGMWEGVEYEGIGEWLMSHADIPVQEYEKLAMQFNPVKFDAAQWVKLAKEAGLKYLVITAKHHDGFAIYDSKISDYDIIDATPYGRDVLKDLSTECKKDGIKFCTYYSIRDWHHPSQEPDRNAEEWEIYGKNLMKEGRKAEYITYMKAQLSEIITQYQPALIWFDGGWTDWWLPEDGMALMQFLWKLKPDLIINNRAAGTLEKEKVLGDYLTPEQYIPNAEEPKDWETCMTMNDTWGFKLNDHYWKSAKSIIHNLADIACKGGNYLLNVGPKADGSIPKESIDRLAEIGRWMQVNSEAIYGTKNWKVFSEGPTFEALENLSEEELDEHDEIEYTSQDIVFTVKDNNIYAICLAWPKNELLIRSINKMTGEDTKSVSMLGSRVELKWSHSPEGLRIQVPADKPCEHAFTFKILTSARGGF
jgi:alpha-L-fucosidase